MIYKYVYDIAKQKIFIIETKASVDETELNTVMWCPCDTLYMYSKTKTRLNSFCKAVKQLLEDDYDSACRMRERTYKQLMDFQYACEHQITNKSTKKSLKKQKFLKSPYKPTCPQGATDCVYDPAYVKYIDPEWYKQLYGNLTPEEASKKDCNPDNPSCYDNEDK